VTLSAEQRDLARARVADAGVADLVEVELCDYRDVRGVHDAVVSVEMVEAVGERYWPVYFAALDRLVRPGGRVALQSITMEHGMMRASRGSYTWMHKYVFPGGLIPSVTAVQEQLRARTSLAVVDRLSFGRDYADTLRVWRESFDGAADRVRELGFDDTFRRMWFFYLAYCEAGFLSGIIDVEQIIMERAR
ncbi:class I SAM-dependent methyltransferase, partial [Nocardiopsis tropica]|nr:class I SAM-dependent methyltransferase [Nocardiopsis tropica]